MLTPLRLALLAALVAAFGTSAAAQPAGPVVLAAASLREVLTEAGDRWTTRGHPAPVLLFGASSAAARQIEAGAPADLFISADPVWTAHVAARVTIVGTARPLATNRLVLVAPALSPLRLRSVDGPALVAALGAGRLAIAEPDTVPAGRYARAVLTTLGAWSAVTPRLAPADDVRAALALVARGACPLGVVYSTDARAEPRVRVVWTFDARTHPPIVYPLVLLGGARSPDAAAFARHLLSPEVRAIFAAHGFGAPPR